MYRQVRYLSGHFEFDRKYRGETLGKLPSDLEVIVTRGTGVSTIA